jgi:hypothetical protein
MDSSELLRRVSCGLGQSGRRAHLDPSFLSTPIPFQPAKPPPTSPRERSVWSGAFQAPFTPSQELQKISLPHAILSGEFVCDFSPRGWPAFRRASPGL